MTTKMCEKCGGSKQILMLGNLFGQCDMCKGSGVYTIYNECTRDEYYEQKEKAYKSRVKRRKRVVGIYSKKVEQYVSKNRADETEV